MKHEFLITVFAIISFSVLTAFTFNAPHYKTIEIKLEGSIKQGDWGPWNQTSCYKGLDFRVMNRGQTYDKKKYIWSVQFRNRYNEKIYFSYEVFDSKPSSPRTTNRTNLDPDKTSDGYRDFYMQNGSSIYVYIDDVRFNKDGLQEFYDCDK
jgi:hypothetical protein